ncbi:MAG: nucleotidyl transferase AbiEii/AbiGii toxin family protein [Candidatus Kerfeldbacteria bacterium]|nr:nucleotidyl transferase AbiEii/AbiGii toxin family protein [Candidatus Kerfeldbacteria bacterium]
MDAHFSIKSMDQKNLHLNVLPAATQKAFLAATKFPFLAKSGWYLAGGTALALQVGHRESVDLDFFTTQKKPQINKIENHLANTGQWKKTLQDAGTLYGAFNKAKMSFISYPFFVPSREQLHCGSIRILLPKDIAVMKIIAISQRGRKRDFVDLYWYCTHQSDSLVNIIYRVLDQYPKEEHNLPHFLKSLTYFEDAEEDPMPKLHFDTSWKKVKEYFRREIPKITKQFLNIP